MMKIAETVIHQPHVQLRYRVISGEEAMYFTNTVKQYLEREEGLIATQQ